MSMLLIEYSQELFHNQPTDFPRSLSCRFRSTAKCVSITELAYVEDLTHVAGKRLYCQKVGCEDDLKQIKRLFFC